MLELVEKDAGFRDSALGLWNYLVRGPVLTLGGYRTISPRYVPQSEVGRQAVKQFMQGQARQVERGANTFGVNIPYPNAQPIGDRGLGMLTKNLVSNTVVPGMASRLARRADLGLPPNWLDRQLGFDPRVGFVQQLAPGQFQSFKVPKLGDVGFRGIDMDFGVPKMSSGLVKVAGIPVGEAEAFSNLLHDNVLKELFKDSRMYREASIAAPITTSTYNVAEQENDRPQGHYPMTGLRKLSAMDIFVNQLLGSSPLASGVLSAADQFKSALEDEDLQRVEQFRALNSLTSAVNTAVKTKIGLPRQWQAVVGPQVVSSLMSKGVPMESAQLANLNRISPLGGDTPA